MRGLMAIILAVMAVGLGLSAAAVAAGSPSGTYKGNVTSVALGGVLKGTWTLVFKSGRYSVADNGKVVIRGKYSISGTKITLGHETGPAACAATGTYTFKIAGQTLRFIRISDTCAGRKTVLAASFTKVS